MHCLSRLSLINLNAVRHMWSVFTPILQSMAVPKLISQDRIHDYLVSKSRRSGELESILIVLLSPYVLSLSSIANIGHAQTAGFQVDSVHNVWFGHSMNGVGGKLMWIIAN